MFNSVFSTLRFGNHDRLPHPEDCQSYFTCLITGMKRFTTTTTIHLIYFTFKKEALDWPTVDGRRCSITRPDNVATPGMCRDGELTALVIVFGSDRSSRSHNLRSSGPNLSEVFNLHLFGSDSIQEHSESTQRPIRLRHTVGA